MISVYAVRLVLHMNKPRTFLAAWQGITLLGDPPVVVREHLSQIGRIAADDRRLVLGLVAQPSERQSDNGDSVLEQPSVIGLGVEPAGVELGIEPAIQLGLPTTGDPADPEGQGVG